MRFALRLMGFSLVFLTLLVASCRNQSIAAEPQSGMRQPVPHLRHSTLSHADCSGATASAAALG